MAEYLPRREAFTRSDLKLTLDLNICKRKPFKVDLIDISKRASFGSRIIHCLPGENNAQLLPDSEPIILLETPRSLSVRVYTKSKQLTGV